MLSMKLHALWFCLLLGLATSCQGPGRPGALRPYPLDTCLVTGNELGSMGDPITRVYGEQVVKFCCSPCVGEFEGDPQRFLALMERKEEAPAR